MGLGASLLAGRAATTRLDGDGPAALTIECEFVVQVTHRDVDVATSKPYPLSPHGSADDGPHYFAYGHLQTHPSGPVPFIALHRIIPQASQQDPLFSVNDTVHFITVNVMHSIAYHRGVMFVEMACPEGARVRRRYVLALNDQESELPGDASVSASDDSKYYHGKKAWREACRVANADFRTMLASRAELLAAEATAASATRRAEADSSAASFLSGAADPSKEEAASGSGQYVEVVEAAETSPVEEPSSAYSVHESYYSGHSGGRRHNASHDASRGGADSPAARASISGATDSSTKANRAYANRAERDRDRKARFGGRPRDRVEAGGPPSPVHHEAAPAAPGMLMAPPHYQQLQYGFAPQYAPPAPPMWSVNPPPGAFHMFPPGPSYHMGFPQAMMAPPQLMQAPHPLVAGPQLLQQLPNSQVQHAAFAAGFSAAFASMAPPHGGAGGDMEHHHHHHRDGAEVAEQDYS